MNNLSNIVKIAKKLIAAGQFKKLLEYLINDSNKSQEECNNKVKQIQKKSFNFNWFTYRFIAQNKHFQDIDNLLKLMQEYQKRKDNINFDFNDNSSFADLTQKVQYFLNKSVKTQEFTAPSYCKLIYNDGKYNYYYADANDKKCYDDLHKCNTKKDGQQYAKWCVVTGTMHWGAYTDSQFPFYVYVTDKQNEPVMLFNFGYNSDCQIKDIHDHAFTQYDQKLLSSIKILAKQYNFNIQKNQYDFKTFNGIDELYNRQINVQDIDQRYITEANKYNGLNFIQKNIIYDFKKNQKAYLISNDNIINLKGYKINLYLLNLLKDKKYNYTINQLCNDDKFITTCSKQVLNFIIDYLIDNNKCYNLYYLIRDDKIKDENQLHDAIQILIDNNKYRYLYYLIDNNQIKDEKQLKDAIQKLIDNNQFDYLYYLIRDDQIKDENQLKSAIQKLIDKKWFDQIYNFIYDNQIKDENQFKDAIQVFIDNNKFGQLYKLIVLNRIKDENKLHDTIQVFIDNNQFDYLYYLIRDDQIKDENQFKDAIQKLINNNQYSFLNNLINNDKIKDENIIQFFIDNNYLDYFYQLIKYDKIKNKMQLKSAIQKLIDNNQYRYLSFLIRDDKIKDEDIVKEIIQKMFDNKKFNLLNNLINNDKIKDLKLIKMIEDAKNTTNVKTSSISKKLYYIYNIVKG